MYKSLIKPILFLLPPEISHTLGLQYIRWAPKFKTKTPKENILATNISGVNLSSPIGLAAGFDKNCYAIGGLYDLGFGFVVGGTITLNAQSGNIKPRLIRVPSDYALINSLGFPNKGINAAAKNLEHKRNSKIPNIFVSLSGNSLDEIIKCQKMITNICSLIEINISSPNSPGLRRLHRKESLKRLIQTLNDLKTCPLFLKVPPLFTSDVENKEVLEIIETASSNGIDGLVTSNSHPISTNQLAVGTGGLSGAPLFEQTLKTVSKVKEITPNKMPIIACGGISNANQVWTSIATGASAVQIYSSFIYEGPGLPKKIGHDLKTMLKKRSMKSITEIQGPAPTINS